MNAQISQMLAQLGVGGAGGGVGFGPPPAQTLVALHCGKCTSSPLPGSDGKSFTITPKKGRGTLTLTGHWNQAQKAVEEVNVTWGGGRGGVRRRVKEVWA